MTTTVLLQAEQLSHLIENCFVKALTQLQSRLSSFRKTGTEMKAVDLQSGSGSKEDELSKGKSQFSTCYSLPHVAPLVSYFNSQQV